MRKKEDAVMRGKIMRTVMTAITLFLLPSLAFSYEVRDEAKRAEILERAGQLQVPWPSAGPPTER